MRTSRIIRKWIITCAEFKKCGFCPYDKECSELINILDKVFHKSVKGGEK